MDKLEKLRVLIVKEGTILGSALVVLIVIYALLVLQVNSIESDIANIKKETLSLGKEAATNKSQNTLIVESIRIFRDLPSQKSALISLNDTASRIRVSRPVIDELRTRYKINEVNILFSKVEEVSSQFDVKDISVFKNQITLDYKALNDVLVLSFASELMKKLPGYVSIEKIEMDRESEITEEVIGKTRAPGASIPSLVKGKLILNWWTMRTKEKDAKPINPDGIVTR